jgi:hypothetical protein
MEPTLKGSRVPGGEEEKVLEVGGGEGCSPVQIYVRPLNCALTIGETVT